MCFTLYRFYLEYSSVCEIAIDCESSSTPPWLSPPISCAAHDIRFTNEWQRKRYTRGTIVISKQWVTHKVAGRGRKADGRGNYAERPRVKAQWGTAIISTGHETSHGRWIHSPTRWILASASAEPERDMEVVEMIMCDLMVWTHTENYSVCCACNGKIIGCLAENGATVTYFLC